MTTRERSRIRASLMTPVPCPSCGSAMPSGRKLAHMLPTTGGVCGTCSSRERREAQVPGPMYETEAWAQGVQL